MYRHLKFLFCSIAALAGWLVGSGLNLFAVRMVQGNAGANMPAHGGDQCRERLKPLHLVSLFRFFGLRGKCSKCRAPISAAFLIGELLTGMLFGIAAWTVGLNWELLAGCFFISVLMLAVQTDLRARIIPNPLTYFAVAAGLLLRLWLPLHPWWDHLAAGIAAGGLFFLLAAWSKGGVGGGDIKLFAFVGLMLGLSQTLLAVFLSCLFGAGYGAALWLAGRYQRRMQIPFAPFIAAASVTAYLWGESIISSYVSYFLSQ